MMMVMTIIILKIRIIFEIFSAVEEKPSSAGSKSSKINHCQKPHHIYDKYHNDDQNDISDISSAVEEKPSSAGSNRSKKEKEAENLVEVKSSGYSKK